MNGTQSSGDDGPRGARWVRAALQVNPYGYIGNPSPSKTFVDEATYNAALIAELKAQQIELIAITDHWNASSASQLIVDVEAAGIVALPGFEANTSEGIHLLFVFHSVFSFSFDMDRIVHSVRLFRPTVSGVEHRPYFHVFS